MSLSAQEISDLARRCLNAHTYGYKIACAEQYARELGYKGEAPPPKVAKFSPAHLLHLLGGAAPKVEKPVEKAAKPAEKPAKTKKAVAAPPPPSPAPPPPAVKEEPPPPAKDDSQELEDALKALDDIAPATNLDS